MEWHQIGGAVAAAGRLTYKPRRMTSLREGRSGMTESEARSFPLGINDLKRSRPGIIRGQTGCSPILLIRGSASFKRGRLAFAPRR